MTSDSRTYLDPEVIDRVSGLELKARLIVEGFVALIRFAEHNRHRAFAPVVLGIFHKLNQVAQQFHGEVILLDGAAIQLGAVDQDHCSRTLQQE